VLVADVVAAGAVVAGELVAVVDEQVSADEFVVGDGQVVAEGVSVVGGWVPVDVPVADGVPVAGGVLVAVGDELVVAGDVSVADDASLEKLEIQVHHHHHLQHQILRGPGQVPWSSWEVHPQPDCILSLPLHISCVPPQLSGRMEPSPALSVPSNSDQLPSKALCSLVSYPSFCIGNHPTTRSMQTLVSSVGLDLCSCIYPSLSYTVPCLLLPSHQIELSPRETMLAILQKFPWSTQPPW